MKGNSRFYALSGIVSLVLMSILLTLNAASAFAQIENYDISATVVDNKVVMQQEISFLNATDYTLNINPDATAMSVYANGVLQTIPLDAKTIELKQVIDVKLSYVTQRYLQQKSSESIFLGEFTVPQNTKKLNVYLTLPKDASLINPLNQQDASIFPKPSNSFSDGQKITFSWTKDNVPKDEGISLFVEYKEQSNLYLYLGIGLIVLLGAIIILVSYKKQKVITKEVVKEVVKDGKNVNIEDHLKEDEQQIITILKRKEGQCDQATLRVITDMSKAKLSRVLKELEERKIIHKELRGKKNMVFLK